MSNICRNPQIAFFLQGQHKLFLKQRISQEPSEVNIMIDIKHIYSFIQIKTCPKNELIFSDIFPAIKLNKVLFVYTQT